MRLTLTKSESLHYIKKKNISGIIIPKFIYFTKKKFKDNSDIIINKILNNFKDDIILRSSSKREDTLTKSNAGKFDSLKIKYFDFLYLDEKIREFIKQFKDNKDQILVQKLIVDVDISGVIFTKDPQTGYPYYIINYDDSGKTDLVTSGNKNPSIKNLTIYKSNTFLSKKFEKYLKIIKKVEKLYPTEGIDLEFAIKNKKFYLFQCRPLIIKKRTHLKIKNLDPILINLKKKIDKINLSELLSGKKTVFSNMADWNPAEMIGSKPTPLSSSLYGELITDKIWSEQRKDYGYKNVQPHSLMFNFLNATYIDVKTDLNSFLPQKLDSKIENKIIKNCIKRLINKPYLHDKIEFEIIDTCFIFDSKDKLNYLNGKEKNEYLKKLKLLTNNIFANHKKILLIELNKIKALKKQIDVLNKKNINEVEKIFLLIDAIKKNGTLPFAGVARCAFIGTIYLKYFLKNNIIHDSDYKLFFENINSISGDIKQLSQLAKKNKYSRNLFLKKYGHLRPSTYSISTLSYREDFKRYFNQKSSTTKKRSNKFKLEKKKLDKIDYLLKKEKMHINSEELLNFTKESIKLREFTKSIFTKAIDEIFISLIKLGKEIKVKRQDFEYLSIKTLIKHYNYLDSEKLFKIIKDEIKINKYNFEKTENIKLPDVITSSNDIYCHYDVNNRGNFITDKNIINEVILFKTKLNFNVLNNKIVFIENADPGYDFLFSYNIKGLVTKYGGANSHMAIRCLEENIPACIGLGEKKFEKFKNKKKLELNCKQKTIKII
jgi:glutamine kinase